MINYLTGDIFESECQALVNPVNCMGVMGAGLAKEFKKKFPFNFHQYRLACQDGEIVLGFMFTTHEAGSDKWIINFPTKKHWNDRSNIREIKWGLTDLRNTLGRMSLGSVALPAVGCGLGGLKWKEVKKEIELVFSLSPLRVDVYLPK